jgi:hypothetical protein
VSALDAYLKAQPGRCPGCGYHLERQSCQCATSEWAIFTAALRQVAVDGIVHQSAMRRLIRGRIEPKHVGQMWRRARREGLVTEAGHERSDDELGKNAGRMEPYYELAGAA